MMQAAPMTSIALLAIVVLLPFAIYGAVTLWRKRAAASDQPRPATIGDRHHSNATLLRDLRANGDVPRFQVDHLPVEPRQLVGPDATEQTQCNIGQQFQITLGQRPSVPAQRRTPHGLPGRSHPPQARSIRKSIGL